MSAPRGAFNTTVRTTTKSLRTRTQRFHCVKSLRTRTRPCHEIAAYAYAMISWYQNYSLFTSLCRHLHRLPRLYGRRLHLQRELTAESRCRQSAQADFTQEGCQHQEMVQGVHAAYCICCPPHRYNTFTKLHLLCTSLLTHPHHSQLLSSMRRSSAPTCL